MTEADVPAGMRLSSAAGWNQLQGDWMFFLTSPGSGGFVAEKDDHVVGTVAYLRYDSLAWIAMMLVDPQERGAGIGAQLLQAALDVLSGAECIGLDATPAGEPLYRRFDFVEAYPIVRLAATARTSPRESGSRRMTPGDMSALRDREVFGADRSRLLTSLFHRAPECAWILNDSHCFGRPGRLYHQLGPVVAANRSAAQDMVARCCSELGGRRVVIDVPRFDEEWLSWLKSIGFVEERPLLRMFRRGHRHPGRPERQYAIAGPEFA